jgi:hypothetical protein
MTGHKAKKLVAEKASSGRSWGRRGANAKPASSQTALSVQDLQAKLPKARVVYGTLLGGLRNELQRLLWLSVVFVFRLSRFNPADTEPASCMGCWAQGEWISVCLSFAILYANVWGRWLRRLRLDSRAANLKAHPTSIFTLLLVGMPALS